MTRGGYAPGTIATSGPSRTAGHHRQAALESFTVIGLTIDFTDDEAHTTVRASGELDMHSAPRLRKTFDDLTAARESHDRPVQLDLGGISFMDSSGLSALIAVHKQVRAAGGVLELHHAGEPVRRMLAVTGMDRVFTVYWDDAVIDDRG